jgi:hypothetical protein
MRLTLPLPLAILLAGALTAQAPAEPRYRIGLGLGGGNFDYSTDDSPLDGDADAALVRLQFEGIGRKRMGGGVRIEHYNIDSDIFDDAGVLGTDAWQAHTFGHFTYRMESHRFAMPMRAGLVFDGLMFEEPNGAETSFFTVGPYFELAPEVTLVQAKTTQWSLYGEFGTGFGGTSIEVDGIGEDFWSFTTFAGVELGTRLTLGPIELGLGFLSRWRWMDESDPENGFVVFGNDSDFQGVLFTCTVVF